MSQKISERFEIASACCLAMTVLGHREAAASAAVAIPSRTQA
jgi:hypothetical protein